eukprot:14000_1
MSDVVNLFITFSLCEITKHFVTGYFKQHKSNVTRPESIEHHTITLAQPITTTTTTTSKRQTATKKPIRVYVEGCWDVMQYGHYNAISQSKALGDIFVVGVHSDAEFARKYLEQVMKIVLRMA